MAPHDVDGTLNHYKQTAWGRQVGPSSMHYFPTFRLSEVPIDHNVPTCSYYGVTGYIGALDGVLMSHVDFKKYICCPVEFKKCVCHHVELKKFPCPMSLSFQITGRMSLESSIRPHVALSF